METPFARLLAALLEAPVRFLVVGGVAVALAGFERFTVDVDLLVDAAPDNLDRLLGTLAGWGEGHAAQLSPDDFPLEEGAVRIIEDFPLDVFTLMSGHTYHDLKPFAVEHDLHGRPLLALGPQGLIRLKAPSRREKDQLDVQALRRLAGSADPDQ